MKTLLLSLLLLAIGITRADAPPVTLADEIHALVYHRTDRQGTVYGEKRIDPLLWYDSRHLLEEPFYSQFKQLLARIPAAEDRETFSPLQRAMVQRDLWQVFDWTCQNRTQWPEARVELQQILSDAIRKMALSAKAIDALPSAPLPEQLLAENSPWCEMGVNGEAIIAPGHTPAFGGRSAFRVFMRHPDGPAAAEKYIASMQSNSWVPSTQSGEHTDLVLPYELPQFPPNTAFVLLRQLILVTATGELKGSPLTESIQMRTYPADGTQTFREWMLDLAKTRAGEPTLRELSKDEADFPFVQFASHGVDPFLQAGAIQTRPVLTTCNTCHDAINYRSVHVLTRLFGHRDARPPSMYGGCDPGRALNATISWKQDQYNWGLLQGLWRR